MNKLDFNATIIGADGQETKTKLGSALAEFIATEQEGNTVKLYGWVKELRKSNSLMLDDADKRQLEELIEKTNRLFIFLKGQYLDVINKK